MEERKLNLNAPLMSVRRASMASVSSVGVNEKKSENLRFNRRNTLPVTRPHFNLDQVTEPVAVPFHWEHIPGKAKNDSGSASPEAQLPQPPEKTSSTPRLSFGFGRALDVKKHVLETEACHRSLCETNSLNAGMVRFESTKTIINDTRCLESENDDDDDAYSDAVDTLSPTDSYSVNDCSVSGISGYNGPAAKPSGTFRTDPQTRDFMMSRFLPAAKAMVLEPSKYSLKKQLVVVEKPRQPKKITCDNRMSPLKQIESTMLLQYGVDEVEEESDSVDDEYDNSGNISARGCGLIPNLCFKNSLGLLNPVPGMRIRTESPMSFIDKVGESGRTTYCQSHSQKIKKHARDAAYKHLSEASVGSPKLQEAKDKWTGESKQFSSSSDQQIRGRSSPFRHSRAASPFRNESQSPRRMQLLVVPKEVEIISKSRMSSANKSDIDFHDTPSIRTAKQRIDPASALIEKTLYVDTASVAEVSSFNSSSLNANEKVEHVCGENETELETRVKEETTSADYSFLEVKCLTMVEEGRLEREFAESKSRDVMIDDSKMNHGLDKEEFGCSSVGDADETESCKANYQIVKVEDPASVKIASVISSQPPPLPKSPSESWLWRTLPSVSSKRNIESNLRNQLHHKKQSPKSPASSTKWETIVKTSKLHHDHVRYSEELIPRVSQHSKTENFK